MVGSVRTGMPRSRQAVTTFWRMVPGADGIAMITSVGRTPSRTRGSSPVVPSTLWPATRMPCLRGSSSTKPTGAERSPGLRRSSKATCWPPFPAPTIRTSLAARSRIGPRVGRSTSARTAKRAPAVNTSDSRKSSARTVRGGSWRPIEKRKSTTITPTVETTTAFRIVSKSRWSTKRQSFE